MDPMGYIIYIYIPPNGKFGKKLLTAGECRGDARFLFGLDCNMPQYAIVMEFLLRSNGFKCYNGLEHCSVGCFEGHVTIFETGRFCPVVS